MTISFPVRGLYQELISFQKYHQGARLGRAQLIEPTQPCYRSYSTCGPCIAQMIQSISSTTYRTALLLTETDLAPHDAVLCVLLQSLGLVNVGQPFSQVELYLLLACYSIDLYQGCASVLRAFTPAEHAIPSFLAPDISILGARMAGAASISAKTEYTLVSSERSSPPVSQN